MRVGALYSGGKDSNYALWCALKSGWDVAVLLTVRPARKDSWMFHYPAVNWTRLQAEAMGIPLVTVDTAGEKEKELNDLKEALKALRDSYGIEGVISGAVDSDYQKARIECVCEGLGLKSFAPLWRKDPKRLLEEEVSSFKIMVTACMALGLTKDWLGRVLDQAAVKDLEELSRKYGIHMAFEGGEAETYVLDGPTFKRRIVVKDFQTFWEGDRGFLVIRDAALVEKRSVRAYSLQKKIRHLMFALQAFSFKLGRQR